jgi:hypothetical protein
MHGGAPGSDAPRGNKNALKYGLYTREAIEERRQLRALMRQSCMLIQEQSVAYRVPPGQSRNGLSHVDQSGSSTINVTPGRLPAMIQATYRGI